jgi:tryptophan synthase alpha chain
MSRITERFDRLRAEGRKGFVPFVTAGDPDVATSIEIVKRLAEMGADVIELGVPFSDPMADGPTIQRSSQRALSNGVHLATVLEISRSLRKTSETPVVLFSYFNPLLSFGLDNIERLARSGIDGVLVTDVVDDEAESLARRLREHEIDLISLIAPTTSDERLRRIADASRGFLYAISRAGVTGAKGEMSRDAEGLVSRARAFTDLPIAVGFGISTREQIADVWRYADAAVVGSAIVSEIELSPPEVVVERIEGYVRGLLPEFAN